MSYKVRITVTCKDEVPDPQSHATHLEIEGFIKREGSGDMKVEKVISGQYIELITNQEDEEVVRTEAEEMCEKLLCNPVIQQYKIVSVDKLDK